MFAGYRRPPGTVIIPEPAATSLHHPGSRQEPLLKRAVRCIAERGRLGWQRVSGYNWRALVESDIARWKRVIGDGLRFQTDKRQATEVAIAADVLNRMLDLGRPEYVRIA